jgi:plasmid stabilization system protein ParE
VEVIYHPLVRQDVAQILQYYHAVSSQLADEFHDELRDLIDKAAENPFRFHLTDRDFRRANLPRFPYHVLYEVRDNFLRVMIVRHNKQHPEFGLKRN